MAVDIVRMNLNMKKAILSSTIFINMIRLQDLLVETLNTKIDELPTGKLFSDAKNIEGIFKKPRVELIS